ncbi:MAG: hypothetical protein J4F37_06705 [Acidobacteria bacterium]|nr:hypothetical protein [Acidobacteriota bacterium]
MAGNSVGVETGHPSTMHTGPLGSTIHVIRADAGTVVELAAIDWNRSFRRVCLDPVRGLITLMAPSRLHEELATILDHVVDVAASALGGAVKGLQTSRLREPGAPPGTGMEPDGAFYVGERARAYRAALGAGKEAADLWLLDGRASAEAPRVEFLALHARKAPCGLTSSSVLPHLTPEDVSEAVGRVRLSVTRDERTDAVASIVRRRQRGSVRVREEGTSYTPSG